MLTNETTIKKNAETSTLKIYKILQATPTCLDDPISAIYSNNYLNNIGMLCYTIRLSAIHSYIYELLIIRCDIKSLHKNVPQKVTTLRLLHSLPVSHTLHPLTVHFCLLCLLIEDLLVAFLALLGKVVGELLQ